MRRWLRLLGLTLVTGALACGAAVGDQASDEHDLIRFPGAEVAGQLADDLQAFQELATSRLPLLVLLLVAAALSSWWVSRQLHRWRLRRGFATGRLTVVAFSINIVFFVVVGVLSLRYLLERVPLIATAILALGAGGLVLVLARELPTFIGGLGYILRRSINEGDRLSVGDVEGTVERVGVLRLVLRRTDGARTYVTLSALGGSSVTVTSPLRVHPVEVAHRRARPVSQEELEKVRVVAALCPYRSGSSDFEVSTSGVEGEVLVVRFQAWSADSARLAEAFLRRTLSSLPVD